MRRLMMILVLCMILSLAANAQEELDPEKAGEELVEQLPAEAESILESMDEPTDLSGGLKHLFLEALSRLDTSVEDGLRLAAMLLCLLTLCSMVDLTGLKGNASALSIAGALGICAAFLGPFQAMMALAKQTIEQLSDYSLCMLPVMASALAITGGVGSSSALYAGTVLFSQLLMQMITHLFLPCVYVFLAVATAEAALDSEMLREIREFIGWVISKSLRVVLYVFVGYMSATGVISGSADAAALKATKAALSGMIPVVGSILSDASEALLASAGLLRSSVGVVGMLAVLAICLVPFLRVGAQYLLLKVTAAVSGTVGRKSHVNLLKHCASAMGYLLAMCGAVCLLLLISCVCFLKVVV